MNNQYCNVPSMSMSSSSSLSVLSSTCASTSRKRLSTGFICTFMWATGYCQVYLLGRTRFIMTMFYLINILVLSGFVEQNCSWCHYDCFHCHVYINIFNVYPLDSAITHCIIVLQSTVDDWLLTCLLNDERVVQWSWWSLRNRKCENMMNGCWYPAPLTKQNSGDRSHFPVWLTLGLWSVVEDILTPFLSASNHHVSTPAIVVAPLL